MTSRRETSINKLSEETGFNIIAIVDAIMAQEGKWVMIVKEVPISKDIAPPLMSIHWAVPWVQGNGRVLTNLIMDYNTWTGGMDNRMSRAAFGQWYEEGKIKIPNETVDTIYPQPSVFGGNPNLFHARRIIHKGEAIRIYPHEFSIMTNEKLKFYLNEKVGIENNGEVSLYELMPSSPAEKEAIESLDSGVNRLIYEQALVDGCNQAQAMLLVSGIKFRLEEESQVPVNGWYRMQPGLLEQLGLV